MSAGLGVVAIVGRPNVGKSTLFNRLAGRRQAIVHDQPGVTRDRVHATAALDDERTIQLIDTGGLVPGDDPIGINRQVLAAVEESDALLFLVDGTTGLTPADQTVWEALRRFGRPTFLLVNKADARQARQALGEFYALGIDPVLLISAEHGEGVADVREALLGLARKLQPTLEDKATPTDLEGVPAIAIVGRPNVGKSSLLNRLLGVERAIVSPIAGTTRDPVDSLLVRDNRRYRLVDTAGIRRRSQVTGAAEDLAVLFARRQAERADAVALVVDASAGITAGDLAIAGMLWELAKVSVVVINKWDLLDEEAREDLERSYPRLDEILAGPLRVNVSANSGRGVEKLLPLLDRALAAQQTVVSTGELNRLLETAIRQHRAPADQGRPWKMYYATQVSSAPPTFMIFANRALQPQHTYRRYLENYLREALALPGVPVRLIVRRRTES